MFSIVNFETTVLPEESPLAKIARTKNELLAPSSMVLASSLLKIVRKVSFYRHVEVLLVPCLADYRAVNVISSVWWSATETKQFRVALHGKVYLVKQKASNEACHVGSGSFHA